MSEEYMTPKELADLAKQGDEYADNLRGNEVKSYERMENLDNLYKLINQYCMNQNRLQR